MTDETKRESFCSIVSLPSLLVFFFYCNNSSSAEGTPCVSFLLFLVPFYLFLTYILLLLFFPIWFDCFISIFGIFVARFSMSLSWHQFLFKSRRRLHPEKCCPDRTDEWKNVEKVLGHTHKCQWCVCVCVVSAFHLSFLFCRILFCFSLQLKTISGFLQF